MLFPPGITAIWRPVHKLRLNPVAVLLYMWPPVLAIIKPKSINVWLPETIPPDT